MLLATGEHEYTRYGFKQLMECGLDVLQPDVTWMGGLTEARRVVAMAAAANLPVIPHGSSVFSYHLVMAFNNCPMAEFSMTATRVFDHPVAWWGPEAANLFVGEPIPINGEVTLSEKPGFGVELIRDNLVRPFARDPSASAANYEKNVAFELGMHAPPRMRL
jgi:L-rhamnonate dehydratase